MRPRGFLLQNFLHKKFPQGYPRGIFQITLLQFYKWHTTGGNAKCGQDKADEAVDRKHYEHSDQSPYDSVPRFAPLAVRRVKTQILDGAVDKVNGGESKQK